MRWRDEYPEIFLRLRRPEQPAPLLQPLLALDQRIPLSQQFQPPLAPQKVSLVRSRTPLRLPAEGSQVLDLCTQPHIR